MYCTRCHEADGTGGAASSVEPDIPNFASADWQRRRSDAQLLASILDGKGAAMPAFRKKLGPEAARTLVSHVRKFAPAAPGAGNHELAPDSFEQRFRRLQDELVELQRQFRELSKAAPDRKPAPLPTGPPAAPTPAEPSAPAPPNATSRSRVFHRIP
jgi:hypothetical protein